MLRDSYLLQVHKLPRHGDNFPDIPDDDSSTLLFCLFRLLMKNCNLVKWASWPPTTVKSVCVCVCVCELEKSPLQGPIGPERHDQHSG